VQLGQDLYGQRRLGGEADLLGDLDGLAPVRIVGPFGGQVQPGSHGGMPSPAGVGGVDDVDRVGDLPGAAHILAFAPPETITHRLRPLAIFTESVIS
jgi:hypothetical protein